MTPDTSILAGSVIKAFLVLGFLCLLAYLILRAVGPFSRFRRQRGGGTLKVVDRLGLEPRRSLYIIETAKRRFLIGAAENGLRLISDLTHEDDKTDP